MKEVENLHARYAHALDEDRLEDWPNFFTERGIYRIATAENEARGLPLPVVYCEGRKMLRDRASVIEMGGDKVGSGDSRITETAVRGLWKAWRSHMGL